MPTTPNLALPYPALSDPANGPVAFQNLATSLDSLIGGAWTAYTPTILGWTIGNGTAAGRYKQIGKTVFFEALLTLGSTTNPAGVLVFVNPVPGGTWYASAGGSWYDTSAATTYLGDAVVRVSGTSLYGRTGANGMLTATVPFSLASTDQVAVQGVYEAS